MKKNLAKILFLTLVALPLLAALPGFQPALAAGKQPLTRMRAVVLPYIAFAPFFIAKDEGFFEEEGLDLEFVRLVQPMQAVAEVAGGTIDMTQVGTRVGIFNAMVRGGNLRIVADKGGVHRGAHGDQWLCHPEKPPGRERQA